jgi:hypothetical protein
MKHKDWTDVLQERLQDVALPLETNFAALEGRRAESSRRAAGNYFSDKFAEKPISAPLSAAGRAKGLSRRRGWWPWVLAGVAAAALAAVLLLRPSSDPVISSDSEESLLAQNAGYTEPGVPAAGVGGLVPRGQEKRPRSAAEMPPEGQPAARLAELLVPSTETAQDEDGEQKTEMLSSNTDIIEDGKGIPDLVREEGPSAGLTGGSLADIAQNDFPEDPENSRRSARRPRLTLHLRASSGGTSISAGRVSSPLVLSWSENRAEIREVEAPLSNFNYQSDVSHGEGSTINNIDGAVRIVQVENTSTTIHTISPAPVLPISFGLAGELALSNHWSLLSGLEYTQRAGYRMAGEIPQALTLHYLGVPLEARFHFLPEKRFRLYLGGGLKAEKCILAKGGEPLQDPFLYSCSLQAGADFRLVPGVRIYMAPVISKYLNRSAYANGWDEQPQFSLRAGLSFDL